MLIRTSIGGSNAFQIATVQAGSAADLQVAIDDLMVELSALNLFYLGSSISGAGDGTQWAASVAYGQPGNGSTYSNLSGASADPLPLSTFGTTPSQLRSRIVVAQGGTAPETAAALLVAVEAAKPNGPLSSIGCALVDFDVVGSANGQQWLGCAVLADLQF